MGWAIGEDTRFGMERDIGYGVPAICDHPGCGKPIDRGLGHVCGDDVYGGEDGCGLFFCGEHLAHRFRALDNPDTIREHIAELRSVAEPVGPQHSYWEIIFDLEAFLKADPVAMDLGDLEEYLAGEAVWTKAICDRCAKDEPHFDLTPDVHEWILWKACHPSWKDWRRENPAWCWTNVTLGFWLLRQYWAIWDAGRWFWEPGLKWRVHVKWSQVRRKMGF